MKKLLMLILLLLSLVLLIFKAPTNYELAKDNVYDIPKVCEYIPLEKFKPKKYKRKNRYGKFH